MSAMVKTPRSTAPAPKTMAVEALLRDPTWWRRTNGWIAEELQVDKKLVANVRAELERGGIPGAGHLTGKDGRVFRHVPLPPRPAAVDPRESDARSKPKMPEAFFWDCPLCRETYTRDGSERAGWVARRFCGRCEYRGVEHELGEEASC